MWEVSFYGSRQLLVLCQQVNDAPFSRDRAKTELNRIIEDGDVIYSRHFKEELANDTLSTADILTVCRAGAIVMAPERDIRTGEWNYRIEGLTTDHRSVAVVFAVRTEEVVFITVFERK